MLNTGKKQKLDMPVLKEAFNKMDTNKDKIVDKLEFAEWLQCHEKAIL